MIHAYKLGGYNIIIDQNSGCVHAVDPVAYDIICRYESESRDQIKQFILEKYAGESDVTPAEVDECFDDIETLKAEGRLFAEDTLDHVF